MQIEAQLDQVVGRLVREVTVLELTLGLVAGVVWRDTEWVKRSLGSLADHITSVRKKLAEFPVPDQPAIAEQLEEAQRIWDTRRAVVHGRWTLLDAATGEYVSERPLPPGEARPYTSHPDWKNSNSYPEVSVRFNLQTLRTTLSRMREAQVYFEDNLDRWEDHFGVEFSEEFHQAELRRIERLRRGPRL